MTAAAPFRPEISEPAGPFPEPANSPAPISAFARLRALLPAAAQQSVLSARELAKREQEAERAPLPTAHAAIDRLLPGGLPRGRLVELSGGRSSGRFSTILALLAAATSTGSPAALIDLGDGLDPATAVRLGLAPELLLWLRPTHVKAALAAADMVLGAGFPVVVVDLGLPPVPGGRGHEATWLRLARAAQAQGAALVVSSPYRVSGTAASFVLAAGRARPAWHGQGAAPRLLLGLHGQLTLEKGAAGAHLKPARLDLRVPQAVAPSTSQPAPALPARAREAGSRVAAAPPLATAVGY